MACHRSHDARGAPSRSRSTSDQAEGPTRAPSARVEPSGGPRLEHAVRARGLDWIGAPAPASGTPTPETEPSDGLIGHLHAPRLMETLCRPPRN